MVSTMNGNTETLTINARIRGRVQGVWFRNWTVEQARARGLSGWVRNRADGSVEAVFSGPSPMVADMLKVCHQGPTAARVDKIDTQDASPPEGEGFQKLPTI